MTSSGALPSFPGFEVIDVLGKGGFSTVYRAKQPVLDRIVAVKVLDLDVHEDDDRRRFERECKAAGKLTSHPHVVQLFGFGFLNDANPYIVMEYMGGGSMADRLKQGPLPVGEVLRVGEQIADALSAAHGEGIFHRDVKPENILVSDRGRLALGDFGISTTDFNKSYSAVNTSFTPLHTAPETIHGQPSTAASDLYSLGSTLYALLTGRAPFENPGQSIAALLMQITTASPPPITRPDVPPAMWEVLGRTLSKDPADRPGSATELRDALRDIAEAPTTAITLPRAADAGRTVVVSGNVSLPPDLLQTGDARRATSDVRGVTGVAAAHGDVAHRGTAEHAQTGVLGFAGAVGSAVNAASGSERGHLWPGWVVPAAIAVSAAGGGAGFALMALLRG